MTWRALALALLLIPLQAFWIVYMELVRGGIWPTVLSLLFTVVFLLFAIAVANLALRRWLPRLALRDQELLALYVLLAAGAGLAGCDVGQTLVHIPGAPYHFATPENAWEQHFHRYLPPWLMVQDEDSLKHFYEGSSTLYDLDNLRPWIKPVASWMVFIALMLATMLGLNGLVRRQWVEAERLTFPIVQVPLAMTYSATFWRQRGLWWGFGLAAGLGAVNGIHALVPAAPWFNCKQMIQLSMFFTDPPWKGIGWMPLTLYPFAIGLGFLMPLDMSFSCWFGLLLWKAQKVLWVSLGHPQEWLKASYSQEQVSGVWLAVVVFAGWMGRREWSALWREVRGGRQRVAKPAEPWGARGGVALVALGLAGMIVFGHLAGMTWGFAVAYLTVYLAFSLSLTRMRAEFGPPCHDLYGAGPDQIFTTWLGTSGLQARNLTATAVFYWLSRESPRSHPMPGQLESMYLAGAGGLSLRWTWAAILLAGCWGALSTWWAVLHNAYDLGSESRFAGPATWFATEGFRRLDSWLLSPTDPTTGGRVAMVLAFAASLGLLSLRSRVLWLPFHPAGYAIASWWAIHLLWFPLLVAWLIKRGVLKYGGARAYRAWRPFFFGLVLGEFVVGSLWQIAALCGHFTAYAFWI